ncbi:MAG: NUDIX hydrolase [Ignavibacterium sp.]|nr:NUDIX hydrolase [Ignavibacterium sp.]MCX7611461.1 NUDIX hydrolase [Ignavibacterium sp.]MDW8374531.1 NUDIX hydrolase [Ignavibacteriales bacterium]
MITESIQSAVLPFRLNGNDLEILLITSIKKKKWIIPKGYVEFGLTPFESAKKEAYEEAGVIGSNETEEIGEFIAGKNDNSKIVKVFLMKVLNQMDDYPEKNLRKRKWFKIDDAIEIVENESIKNILLKLKVRFNTYNQ